MQFPKPIKIGPSSTRWKLSDLEAYEAGAAGESPPPPREAQDERYLSVQAVAARYEAHVCTVWRWVREREKTAA
jgi:hypothetical protein